MTDGPRLLVRSAPRFRLGSVMRASERRPGAAAVRNSPFAGVILATAAFSQIDEKKCDTSGRNIDRSMIGPVLAGVKEARKTPFMICAYSSSDA
ncbi:hypothetical protein [Mesorhizobium sp.]|uniref:hypothetical protein n=1 Tax=Mesorhizobium sp. TaxID=1871066 RepID=UPI0025C238AF|nr:hypothetical protein [Mesorhizobium sp.]